MTRDIDREGLDRLGDEQYFKMISTANLSDNSKKGYINHLKKVKSVVSQSRKKDVELGWIVRHARRSYDILAASNPKRKTLKTWVASVLALLKHSRIKQQQRHHFNNWYNLYKPLKKEDEEKDSSNVAEGRSLEGAIRWKEVVEARDRSGREEFGSKEHLVLSMFSMMGPRRQGDFHRVRLLLEKPFPKGYKDESAYLDLTQDPAVVTVTEYKTKKFYENWTKDLPPDLTRVILSGLDKDPNREYLFVQKNGEPFNTVNAFTQFTNRVFKKWLGPKVTLNSLRHAAAEENIYDRGKRDPEKDAYANDMGHSAEMHKKYRKVITDDEYEKVLEERERLKSKKTKKVLVRIS